MHNADVTGAAPKVINRRSDMTCHTKEDLERMLYDVVNELDLSDAMLEKHGPHGTEPAILVREVLAQKDMQIRMLRQGFVEIGHNA